MKYRNGVQMYGIPEDDPTMDDRRGLWMNCADTLLESFGPAPEWYGVEWVAWRRCHADVELFNVAREENPTGVLIYDGDRYGIGGTTYADLLFTEGDSCIA